MCIVSSVEPVGQWAIAPHKQDGSVLPLTLQKASQTNFRKISEEKTIQTIALVSHQSSHVDLSGHLSEKGRGDLPLSYTATYIGPAILLPDDLQALCSCADLFFARLVRRCGEGYTVLVAALTHYFDAPVSIKWRHVRSIFLGPDQCEQLLEWDRYLAGLATCDVRDLVMQHVSGLGSLYQSPASRTHLTTTDQANKRSEKQDKPTPVEPAVFFCEGPQITVPLSALQEAAESEGACVQPERAPTAPQSSLLLLQAALFALMHQRACEHNKRLRQQILRQEQELRRVLAWRKVWKPRLDVTVTYARGKQEQIIGCILQVGVPLPLVA